MNVKSNIAKEFLSLVDKHFPTHNRFHKIFNRSTLKVSYSCMPNISNIISSHNASVLNKQVPPTRLCNCNDKPNCPLDGKCLEDAIIYNACVTTENSEKHYIGLTEPDFKHRYANHLKSIRWEIYKKESELSIYIWQLKNSNQDYSIKWTKLKNSKKLSGGANVCPLCNDEKLLILNADKSSLLNKRDEIVSKCRHI